MYWNLFGTFSILVTCCLCGFVAFAYYFGCDPVLDKKISKYDQVIYLYYEKQNLKISH